MNRSTKVFIRWDRPPHPLLATQDGGFHVLWAPEIPLPESGTSFDITIGDRDDEYVTVVVDRRTVGIAFWPAGLNTRAHAEMMAILWVRRA